VCNWKILCTFAKIKKQMTRGKKTCKILKEIRQQIADKNDIEYVTSECHFQGECQGTCPKCEAELQYLENELSKRRQLGKAVAVAGISLGIASTFSTCNISKQSAIQQDNMLISEDRIRKGQVGLSDTDTITIPREFIEYEDFISDTINEKKINEEIYELEGVIVETMPEYPGGDEARIKFLAENLVYPQEAKEKKIEGRVFIGFVVEIDGSLTNFSVVRSIHPLLDKEALRVVKLMPKWIPGEQRGKPVRVQFQIPVTFTLN